MASWQIVNNELVPIDCSKPAHFVNPTPISIWSIQNGVLTNGAEPTKWGAFINSNLSHVNIPSSVKEIGEFTFYNTKLKTVTISKDCKYYPTSFPEDCKINFYN